MPQNAHAVPLHTRMMLSAIAGMGAVNVCHPLDVIRIQKQTVSNKVYRNTWQVAQAIYQRAGLRNGLYAGISAAYLRQILYGSCRMGIYSHLLEQQQGTTVSLQQKVAMGCMSGGIGSLVGTPAEVALVRMSTDSNYTSVVDCLYRIVKEEGVLQLWRGATPTVARATLLSGCSLGMTSHVKELSSASAYFNEDGPYWYHGYPVLLIATTVSSFFANLVSNPFDVIKSRLQNKPVLYHGVWDCLITSVRTEGMGVLWKGFTPAFLKLAPYSIISLTLLDKLTLAVTGKDAL